MTTMSPLATQPMATPLADSQGTVIATDTATHATPYSRPTPAATRSLAAMTRPRRGSSRNVGRDVKRRYSVVMRMIPTIAERM
jgi:hypothetical protein